MTNSEKLLKVLGGDPNAYATNYGVRKAILSALGGNPESCSNINEVDLEILRIYESGGGGTGGTVVLETANITKNGTYVPSEGYNGFDKAIVNVVPVLETANITKNGTYVPSSGYDGFNTVTVNIINPTEVWILSDGTKLSNSTWSSLPTGLYFSNVTDFSYMFNSCSKLTTIPLIDTSNGTSFANMFNSCSSLTSIPQLDTSNGTSFGSMFHRCGKLTTIPLLDTSNGTNFNQMFYQCGELTTIPQLNTSKATSFGYVFQYCYKIITIPQLNVSKCDSTQSIFAAFSQCRALENITFVGSINTSIDFVDSTLLTYDSVKSILTACSNTTKTTTSKTLKFSRTLTDQNGELAALVATCNTKGWTISGLTLN